MKLKILKYKKSIFLKKSQGHTSEEEVDKTYKKH